MLAFTPCRTGYSTDASLVGIEEYPRRSSSSGTMRYNVLKSRFIRIHTPPVPLRRPMDSRFTEFRINPHVVAIRTIQYWRPVSVRSKCPLWFPNRYVIPSGPLDDSKENLKRGKAIGIHVRRKHLIDKSSQCLACFRRNPPKSPCVVIIPHQLQAHIQHPTGAVHDRPSVIRVLNDRLSDICQRRWQPIPKPLRHLPPTSPSGHHLISSMVRGCNPSFVLHIVVENKLPTVCPSSVLITNGSRPEINRSFHRGLVIFRKPAVCP